MNSFFKNLLVIFSLMFISGATSITHKYVVLIVTIILLFFYLINNKKLSKFFIIFFIVWCLINFVALIINGGSSIPYIRIISFGIVYFLYPYLLLELIGLNFWKLFEKWIYIFTKISIPLFVLNYLDLSFFNSLYPIFSSLTNPIYTYPYWSSLVYVNAVDIDSLIRNSGFMWEPGAFAMMIVFALIYNWLTNGVKYDRKFYIYIIALITTFSTAGYIAVVFIVVGSLMKKFNLFNIISLLLFLFVFSNNIYNQDFLKGKLEVYQENFNENDLIYDDEAGLIKVNRYLGAYYSIIDTIDYPLGYGLISENDYSGGIEIYGTNGLGSMLKMWGVLLFVFYLILLKRFLYLINRYRVKRVLLYLMFLALLTVFFSNPISRNVFTYFIIFTPFLFKNKNLFNKI